ncbi:MAG TPA: hypothetical protein VF202_14570 [Trueperaceae bacterium]
MILVISYPEEDHTVEVVRRLEARGRDVAILDLGTLPASGMQLTWSVDERPEFLVGDLPVQRELLEAKVCWWRRVRPFVVEPRMPSPHDRAFAESETSQAVNGMLDSLRSTWVNDRSADAAAHHKPLQWTRALELGFKIPRTLVTNRPDAARMFIASNGGRRTVFKAFLASYEAWRETRLVEKEDLERLESVRLAPVIFQEYIPGVDLRITVVGESIFAAEIDARSASYPVDMRMVIGEADVRPIRLPHSLEQAILLLQRRLGLTYGAIDMRRTSDGEYYFFEVNPAGQWLFVEHRTGLPISDAVAELLAKLDESGSSIGASA